MQNSDRPRHCAFGIRAEDLQLNSARGFSGPTGGEHSLSIGSLVGCTLAEIERQAIIETLKHCDGNKALSARTLGISEKSIYNKMKRLGIEL